MIPAGRLSQGNSGCHIRDAAEASQRGRTRLFDLLSRDVAHGRLLRQSDPAQQIAVARVEANVFPKWVYPEIEHAH
jgi:hypothetical protein